MLLERNNELSGVKVVTSDTVDVSRSQEDFLKSVLLLRSAGTPVTNSELAQAMDVSPAAVSGHARRLGQLGLLTYERYQEIELTARGRLIALEVLRHHRLLELFFTETLQLPWDVVHQIAEKLEHDLDEVLEDAIDRLLNNPQLDPHGDPIPDKQGRMPEVLGQLLSDIPVQEHRRVVRVLSQEAEVLTWLGEIGLRPGASILVKEKLPLDGPLRIKVNGTDAVIGNDLAQRLLVTKADSQ